MHSNSRIPFKALRLLIVAGFTLALSFIYIIEFNPEIVFWKDAALVKRTWAREMTRRYQSKVVVYAGSSCAFSLDGERLLEKHGIPTVNMGLAAGMKASMLTQWALSETNPGDTLIIALEPGLLAEPLDQSSMAVQFSMAMHSLKWLDAPWLEHHLSLVSTLLALRPGAQHVVAMMGKLIGRAPLYRYNRGDVHPSGWLTTPKRLPFPPSGQSESVFLSNESRTLLKYINQWAASNHVRVAYSLPWCYTTPENIKSMQNCNRAFLLQVLELIPVLKDPRFGASSQREYFADTPLHLSSEGAVLRTDELAHELNEWSVWTQAELK